MRALRRRLLRNLIHRTYFFPQNLSSLVLLLLLPVANLSIGSRFLFWGMGVIRTQAQEGQAGERVFSH